MNESPALASSGQTHVHEFLGSVEQCEECAVFHSHRFAGVSSSAILNDDGTHYHVVEVNTDFFNHYHEVAGETGPDIAVGNGKHVHFMSGDSTFAVGHYHDFQFATLINAPMM